MITIELLDKRNSWRSGFFATTGTRLAVLDGAASDPVQILNDVGLRPEQPVEHEGYVWLAFQESNRVGVFDACSGALLRIYPTGKRPIGPVAVGDAIWLYNAQDDSVQRLVPFDLPASSCIGAN